MVAVGMVVRLRRPGRSASGFAGRVTHHRPAHPVPRERTFGVGRRHDTAIGPGRRHVEMIRVKRERGRMMVCSVRWRFGRWQVGCVTQGASTTRMRCRVR